jgi:hypothetical protein
VGGLPSHCCLGATSGGGQVQWRVDEGICMPEKANYLQVSSVKKRMHLRDTKIVQHFIPIGCIWHQSLSEWPMFFLMHA